MSSATGALPAAARIVARALKLRRPLSPRRRHLDRAFMLWRYIARAFQALSYERLRFMFRDAFGLIVSEGALMNMFIRSHAGFKIEADKAKAILRQAKVVASDETGVRIEGTILIIGVPLQGRRGASARLFACRPCRGRDDERPYAERLDFGSLLRAAKAWRRTSNLFGASGARHGLCAGAWIGRSAPAVQAVVWQGLRSGQRYRQFRPPRQSPAKSASLKSNSPPFLPQRQNATSHASCRPKSGGRKISFLIFCDYPGEVEATNNGSERKLRPCVIQRKVTNGYRAMWPPKPRLMCAQPSTPQDSRAQNPFQTILDTLV